jgi:methylmalonyl-CoA mutase
MAEDILKEIYQDFKENSKEDWIQQANKDLKDKNISDIDWQLNAEITQAAYYAASDLPTLDHSSLKQHNPDWQVGEHYMVEDFKVTNTQLLKDLMHGLNAPVLSFKNSPSLADFKDLFKEVGLEHIFIHFDSTDNQVYLAWQALLAESKVQNTQAYFRLETDLDAVEKSEHIDARSFYSNTAGIHKELKHSIQAVRAILLTSEDKQSAVDQIHFSFFVDKSYLASIAKLRAIKLLWISLMKENGLSENLPFISVEFAPSAYGSDEQDNLINATSMAMSAVIGGANHLIVRPTSETSTALRLARNIQLILKYESGLNKVADPAQGSYYVESLTSKLVNYCS